MIDLLFETCLCEGMDQPWAVFSFKNNFETNNAKLKIQQFCFKKAPKSYHYLHSIIKKGFDYTNDPVQGTF